MFISEPGSNDLHLFACLTHTHKWGYSVRGYKVSLNETTNRNEIKEICKGSPQWPQQFYLMSNEAILSKGEGLMARCSYNTMDSPNDISMGKKRYLNYMNRILLYMIIIPELSKVYFLTFYFDRSSPFQ